MSQRIAENTKSGANGALCAFAVYSYTFLKNTLNWNLPDIIEPDNLSQYVEGLVMMAGGGGAIAAYYRDRLSPREQNAVVPNVGNERQGNTALVQAVEPAIIEKSTATTQPTAYQPIDLARLKAEIKAEEGVVFEVYLDHKGNPTLGIGHLILESDPEYGKPVGTKVSKQRVYDLFSNDVANAIGDAQKLVDEFESLPLIAKHVLVQMAFQMGYSSVKGFKQTRRYFNSRQWRLAADEMLDSDWYREDTPARALRLSNKIKSLSGPDIGLT